MLRTWIFCKKKTDFYVNLCQSVAELVDFEVTECQAHKDEKFPTQPSEDAQ